MGAIARIWSELARARQRVVKPDEMATSAGQRKWIEEHVPGRSFADIGGMYQLMGEMAFLAEAAGASAVTLFDVGDPDLIAAGHPEWGWFEQKKAERDSKVRYVQGDLEDPESVRRLGPHDIVYYSGVLYHTPNPFQQLAHLRQVTRELALIATITIPEIPGFDHACVFYPYLDERARAPFSRAYPTADGLLAIGPPFDDRPMYGYGNCWWGITRSALVAMLRAARFEVVGGPWSSGRPYYTALAVRPLPMDPSLPPQSYFRERGDSLARGEGRLPFDDWYDVLRERDRID
jgi:hypothetical protein